MFRKRVGDYYLGRTLGEGTYAKVKYGRHVETGEEVAVKIMRKDRVLGPESSSNTATATKNNGGDGNNTSSPSVAVSASRSRLTREIAILRRLRHPNLVMLRDVLASKDKVYVVMEFVAGGELFDRVAAEGPLPENEARRLFQQLADALAYCHSAGVFHRDLKPENVLLTREGDVKLSDFGFGHLSIGKSGGGGSGGGGTNGNDSTNDDFMLSTACGTPAFVAPEVLARKGYEGGPADVWSLGVTLAVMLSGRLPFDEPSLPRLFRKIAAAEFSLPPWVPRGGADLVSAMLRADPRERPTLERVFEHPWVRPGLRRAAVPGVPAVAAAAGAGSSSGSGSRSKSRREATPLSPRSASAAAAAAEKEDDPFSDSVPPVAERTLDAAEAAEASVRGGGAAGAAGGGGSRLPSGGGGAGAVNKMNAFTLLSAALDLSGLLAEREGCVRRHTRFTTRCSLDQVHACLARAAEAVGGRAFGGGVAAIEALATAAAAEASSARPLPASAWRARLELPVVVVAAATASGGDDGNAKNSSGGSGSGSGGSGGHRAPTPAAAAAAAPPLRLFVSARVDIAPLLPGTLVVDVTRAGGAAAADFYQAYGPFEAAVLEELAAEKAREREREREREAKQGGGGRASPALPPPQLPPTAAVAPPQPPSPPPPPQQQQQLPPLAPSPSPPPPLPPTAAHAVAAARSSGTATPELNEAASIVGARARGSLLASSASLSAFSAGERGGGGGLVVGGGAASGGISRVSSLRSLRSAGSGGGGGGQGGLQPRRSGREDFWDDDGSSGDDFDAFDDDDDDDDRFERENEEEDVAAVERLVLD